MTTKKTIKAKKTVSKKTVSKKTAKTVQTPIIESVRAEVFKSNIDKLDMNVHRRTHDTLLGTVTLKKAASENKGKRLFSVSSKAIHSGVYTRKTLMAAIDAFYTKNSAK